MKRAAVSVALAALVVGGYAAWSWVSEEERELREIDDAVVAFKNGQFESALPALEHFANNGRTSVVDLVAKAYLYGYGVEPDLVAAVGFLSELDESRQRWICSEYLDNNPTDSDHGLETEGFELVVECAKGDRLRAR